MLSDDFASWGRLLIRDNQSTIGSLVNVIILGVGLGNHSKTKKQGRNKMQDSKLYLASGERPFSVFLDDPF